MSCPAQVFQVGAVGDVEIIVPIQQAIRGSSAINEQGQYGQDQHGHGLLPCGSGGTDGFPGLGIWALGGSW